jgi:hypothetical protein
MGNGGMFGLLTRGRVDRQGGGRKVRKIPSGWEGSMWCVKAEAHDGLIYTLRGDFPNRRSAESFKIVAARWRRVWVEPTPAESTLEVSR